MKNKTGVQEWAKQSVNIQIGCEHDCRYCYARYNAVNRYKYCPSNEAWATPIINQKKVDMPYKKKYKGVVMFPTSHCITPQNISEYMVVLKKLLRAGNQVLIVSKPTLGCIKLICGVFTDYKDQILFRFTIGSTDDSVLKFWEPNAPDFESRFFSLKYAYEHGYKTSVSCEPYLDPFVGYVYYACRDFITDTFWIGKMRGWNSRLKLDDVTPEQHKRFILPLHKARSDEFVAQMYKYMCTADVSSKIVRWKDSIREVIDAKRLCSTTKDA